MKRISMLVLIFCTCFVSVAWGQRTAGTDVVVPSLVNFSGVLTDTNNKLLTSAVGVTFALYTDEQGGAPLWVETQNVQPDKTGHYSVMLGSTLSQGLPSNLFASGAARWLGVQAQGLAEQPRVLLVAVPYALKALDAETIGGKPASAFALATPAGTSVATNPVKPTATQNPSGGGSPSISGSGKPGYIPEWLSTTKLGDSALFQSSAGNLGIATIAPAQKLEIDLGNMLVRGANNFGKAGDTAFLYVGDTNHPIEAIWNTGLAIGTFKVPHALFIQDKTGNVGIGTTAPAATLDVNGTVNAATSFNLEGRAFAFGSFSNQNAFLGFSGNATTTGTFNTAIGTDALRSNTTGGDNTASGLQALYANTTGSDNTASGAGRSSPTPRASTTPPAAAGRSSPTPRATATPPAGTSRSPATPRAAGTPPAVLKRSVSTRRAATTQLAASRRSSTTRRAASTRSWAIWPMSAPPIFDTPRPSAQVPRSTKATAWCSGAQVTLPSRSASARRRPRMSSLLLKARATPSPTAGTMTD